MAWLTSLWTTFVARFRTVPNEPAPRSAVNQAALEQLIGVRVTNVLLYEQALMHRSKLRGQSNSHLASNERLEFLGDAVLGMVTAEHLYDQFPGKDEGFLTRLRAKLVNGQALARVARELDLGRLILMSQNMAQADGRDNTSILADALEAVIGALYLDSGIDEARAFIHRTMLDNISLQDLAKSKANYKSLLLEFVQARGWRQPQYRVLQEQGPSHNKTFTVEVVVDGKPYGQGIASSKKKAEQKAARATLEQLREAEATVDKGA